MKVVHCKKAKYDVYIGRPSKWGNPFVIGQDGTRAEVIGKYRAWIQTQPDLMNSLYELKDKILGCHCSPLPCHGDVLIDLVEGQTEPVNTSIISCDTETTGIDHQHGARAFLVTTCNNAGEVTYWEAFVDPLTRMPIWGEDDLAEIQTELNSADKIVFHNPRFDVKALTNIDEYWNDFPWDKVEDTLLMSHLVASNQPHDLTNLSIVELGVNIEPFELEMEEHVREAVKLAKSEFPKWSLAKAGDPSMPSAKEKVWKFDMWVPRAVAMEKGYDDDHPWWHCTANYANSDSSVTLPLYHKLLAKIKKRNLEEIYKFRLKLLPVISKMEKRGVHASKVRFEELRTKLSLESDESHLACLELADHEIEKLPKNGSSNDLKYVIFEKFGLESPYETASGAPSMDKGVLDHWLATLPEDSKPYKFVNNLRKYRKRQTSLGYMESYEKFWLPTKFKSTMVLFPSFNPTGTDTLRFSSQNPNAQQISKQEDVNLRYCFGPAPGREWWSLDAKNIELRLPAYESGEEELISLFERPDDPPYFGSTHLLNFHTVYPDLWEAQLKELTKELGSVDEALKKVGPACKKQYASTWYQWCKNMGFAIQYGAVNVTDPDRWGTADSAAHRKGAHSLLEKRFSRLQKLNRKQIDYANKYGYVETMPDRTVDPQRGYPLLCSRSKWGKVLETVPLSYHVQGTAMWWTCRAMVQVQEYLDSLNGSSTEGYFVVMQVHDEIVLDFPAGKGSEPWKRNLPKIRRIAHGMAQIGLDFKPAVKTPVGIEYHAVSWNKGKTFA